MTTAIFEKYFEKFAEKTRKPELRPMLLILDGHVSHLSLKTVMLAREENIAILKLPAHCTDLLQPLDVSCFAPLKSYYETKLLDHVHATGARDPVRRSKFADILCSIWFTGLSDNNIKAGFRATGIFPLDRTKYNQERLDPIKIVTYEKWIADGRPVDDKGSPMITPNSVVPYTYHLPDQAETEDERNIITVTSPSNEGVSSSVTS